MYFARVILAVVGTLSISTVVLAQEPPREVVKPTPGPIETALAREGNDVAQTRQNMIAALDRWRDETLFSDGDVLYTIQKSEIVNFDGRDLFRQFVTVIDSDGQTLFRDWHQIAGRVPLKVADPTRYYIERTNDGNEQWIVNVENPKQAVTDVLISTVRTVTDNYSIPWLPESPGTVTTVFSDTSDGFIRSIGTDWTLVQQCGDAQCDEELGDAQSTSALSAHQFSAGNYAMRPLYLHFDTSGLPDSDVVSSVVLSLFSNGSAGTNTIGTLDARIFSWDVPLDDETEWIDYSTTTNWTTLTQLATLARSDWTNGISAENSFLSTGSFAGEISLTGTTSVIIANDTALSVSAPAVGANNAGIFLAENTGTSSDPRLVITHEPPAPETPMLELEITPLFLTVLALSLSLPVLGMLARTPSFWILTVIPVIFVWTSSDTFLWRLLWGIYIILCIIEAWGSEQKRRTDRREKPE